MATTYPHYNTPCAWLYADDEDYQRARSCYHWVNADVLKARREAEAASKPTPEPAANPIGHNGKHTNADLRKAIQDHFAKTGRRMTNISTADKKKLTGIIEKYNIELPELVKKEQISV